MKNTIIILLILSAAILVANPIQPYVDIKELRFTDSGWEMELFSDYIGEENSTLDSCFIVCNAGSSYVQPGTEYQTDTLLVITQADLITPLAIDPAGDEVDLFFFRELFKPKFWQFGRYDAGTHCRAISAISLGFCISYPWW
ncbi:MAG: hypothetical protein SVM86_08115 [Candidatus Cloacimonadota bacterium]|nr:hypothetical protein [Candidatus Cloacimonadota bacterium]